MIQSGGILGDFPYAAIKVGTQELEHQYLQNMQQTILLIKE